MDKHTQAVLFLKNKSGYLPNLSLDEAIAALACAMASEPPQPSWQAAAALAQSAAQGSKEAAEAVALLLASEGAEGFARAFAQSPLCEAIMNSITGRLAELAAYAASQRKALSSRKAYLRHIDKSAGEMRRLISALADLGASEGELSYMRSLLGQAL